MRSLAIIASMFGALGVILGAFGAHAFEDILIANNRLDTFETAVDYHFYHTLAVFIPVLLIGQIKKTYGLWSSLLFLTGILLFSGSLYILSFTKATFVAFITPFGGLAFILGWLILSYGLFESKFSKL